LDRKANGNGDGRQLSMAALVAALSVLLTIALLYIAFLRTRQPATAPIQILPPPPTATRSPTATPAPLNVYVTGAVNRPGVVLVPPDARVQEAVAAAGGPAEDADLGQLNLAAALFDGQHLRVPAEGETPVSAPMENDGAAGAAGVRPININSATAGELTALPGVGEVTAAKIVAYRQEHGPFYQIEEIMEVPGIAEGKFDGFKELITVGP
jgi:competence protein ComEA